MWESIEFFFFLEKRDVYLRGKLTLSYSSMVPVFVRFGGYYYRSHICIITGNKMIFSFSFFFASGVYEMTVRKYETIVTHFYMIFPHMNRREDDYFGFHIYAILHSKV